MDQRIRSHKLAAAREIAADFAGRDDVSAVFLTGSLLAGLGNVHSDVDIYVIAEWAGSDTTPPLVRRRDGVRADIEVRTAGWLTNLAEKAGQFSATEANLSSIQRPGIRLGTAVRVLLSEPVKRSVEYDTALATLRANQTELRRYLMASIGLVSLSINEDCIGALRSGDDFSAAISAASLVNNAAQSYLVGAGDPYQGEKWIPERMRRSAGASVPIVELLSVLAGTAAKDPRRLSVLRLRLAQIMSVAAMTYGWESADADAWERWNLERDDGIRASPGCLPLRISDAIILSIVPDRQFKMSERALIVWALCQGGTIAEIAADAEKVLAGTRWATDTDTIAKMVAKFVKLGVVVANSAAATDSLAPASSDIA